MKVKLKKVKKSKEKKSAGKSKNFAVNLRPKNNREKKISEKVFLKNKKSSLEKNHARLAEATAKRAKSKKLIKRKRKEISTLKVNLSESSRKKHGAVVLKRDHWPLDSTLSLFIKPKIRLIGIGGGGGSIISELSRSLTKTSFVIADTDARFFKKNPRVKYFLFGKNMTHGLGTGLDTDIAREAAQAEKENISKLFEGQDIVILISCLGGGLGSGATPVFSLVPQDFKGIVLGIFTTPFKFEGLHKYKIAKRAFKEIKELLNVSLVIDNEKIFKVIDNQAAITDAFSMVNKNLVESLGSLIDIIYNPGLINIDFADLKSILKGRGNMMFLNTAEASGKDRAEKIVQKVLHNPLYQNNNFKSEKVLFNFSSGENLGMFEVNSISQAISQVNPQAKIIFGISKNKKQHKNNIKITLLMTGSQAPLVSPVAAKITTKKVKKKAITKTPAKNNNGEKAVEIPNNESLFESPVAQESLKLGIEMDPSQFQTASRKVIRRSGLEVKKSREIDSQKKSQQEKEWEIPAFLRFKK